MDTVRYNMYVQYVNIYVRRSKKSQKVGRRVSVGNKKDSKKTKVGGLILFSCWNARSCVSVRNMIIWHD